MIGSLRHRIVFEQKTQVDDTGGGFAESWQTLATVFGAVEFVSGRERVSAGQIVAERTLRIHIRFREDITPDLRLRWKGQVFGIDWVNDPDGKRHWLEIGCTENFPS